MKKRNECKIIQDLFPNYIENLISEESKKYVSEHLEECKECQEVLKNMQEKDLCVKEKSKCNTETNYLKKINKKFRVLIFLLVSIFIIFSFFILKRAFIVNDLNNKARKFQNTVISNRYSKIVTYSTEYFSTIEIYQKDNNFWLKSQNYKYGEEYEQGTTNQFFMYKLEDKTLAFEETKQGKKEITGNIVEPGNRPETIQFGTASPLRFLLFAHIQKVTFQERECYLIQFEDFEQYVDIETGLVLRFISNNEKIVKDYYHEFGNIQDSDILKLKPSDF